MIERRKSKHFGLWRLNFGMTTSKKSEHMFSTLGDKEQKAWQMREEKTK